MKNYLKFSMVIIFMFSKIKKFFCWEFILFIFINIAILMNVFIHLNLYFGELLTNIDNNIHSPHVEGPGLFVGMVFICLLLMPLFVLIKYLSLPAIILIIQKWSKKEQIKNWIKTIDRSYKLQSIVLFIALLVDFIPFLVNYVINFIMFDIYGNPAFHPYMSNYIDTFKFSYLFFGGLTGSYLVIFLFLFVRKKFKALKQDRCV